MANLQLLHGPVNLDKRAKLPVDWIGARFPEKQARDAWLAESDLLDIPESFDLFLPFHEKRRSMIRQRLANLLSGDTVRANVQAAVPVPVGGSISALSGPPTSVVPAKDPIGVAKEARTILSPAQPSKGSGRTSARRTRRSYQEKLSDLVGDGRLLVGESLGADFRGHRYVCTVEMGGSLRFRGRSYDDPTPAAQAVNGGTSVNGWGFWSKDDGTAIGKLRRY